MSYSIIAEKLIFSYSPFSKPLFNNLDFTIEAGSITGLLGRNGCGKSTLAHLLTGLHTPSSGTITMSHSSDEENNHESIVLHKGLSSSQLAPSLCFVGEDTSVYLTSKLKDSLELWAAIRPNWDNDLAYELLDAFRISPKKKLNKLSRGQRSIFFAILGLASRAPLTIFDEVHLGMDAVNREMFYQILMRDYLEHPRTIAISSHLIDEIENLLSHVIILDEGRIIAQGDVDRVREEHMREDGKTPRLTEVLMNLTLTENQRTLLTSNALTNKEQHS